MQGTNKKSNWFPTPRYLCRKAVVLNFLDEINKGAFLEVGMGAGDLILELAKKKYQGVGIDVSDEAVKIVREKLKNIKSDVKIQKRDFFDINENFNVVIFLEIIEHIKDDTRALKKIHTILNKDGHLIISAPAHKRDWDINDKWAGHYRRYEKNELQSKLERTGFKVIKLYNYGFPIANIANPIRNYLIKKEDLSEKNRKISTEKSGIDRNNQKKFSFMINKFTMAPFLFLQKLFFNKDWGNGYIILAKK